MHDTQENMKKSKERTLSIIINTLTAIVGIWAVTELYDFEDLKLDIDMPESLIAMMIFGLCLFIRHVILTNTGIQNYFSDIVQHSNNLFQNFSQTQQPNSAETTMLSEGICSFAASGNHPISYCNDTFCAMIGYSKDTLLAQKKFHFTDLIVPQEHIKLHDEILQVALEGKQIQSSYHMKRNNEQIIAVTVFMKAVKDSQNKIWIQSAFIEQSSNSTEYDELKKNAKRNEILLSQLNDIIFEIDIQKDILTYSMNWENKLASEIPTEHVSTHLKESKIIHPDDLSIMEKLLSQCKTDVISREEKVRLYGKEDKYIWCIIRMCGVKDENGTICQIIGTVTDCDKQSMEVEQLRKKAEMDGLTELYNKYTIEEKIKVYLTGKLSTEQGLMFIIDMDNFKQVNDTYGHHTGDYVLQQTGRILREFAQKHGGEAGRIGGDEFLIFLYNVSKTEDSNNLLQQLHSDLHIQIPDSQEIFSGSIGLAATCPEDTFDSLYMKADKSLYEEKKTMKSKHITH